MTASRAEERPAGRPAFLSRDARTAVGLFVLAFVVYNANLRLIGAGDTRAARFVPLALLRSGRVTVEAFAEEAMGTLPGCFWLVNTSDFRLASTYPIVTPLAVTPLYVPVALYLRSVGWMKDEVRLVAARMEKISASLVAAAAVAAFHFLLRRRLDARDALLLTVAFAFATNTWSTSSQALWQHGLAELLLIGAIAALDGEPTARRSLAVGTLLALLAANRSLDALLAVPLGLLALWRAPRRIAWLALPVLAIGGLTLAYNLWAFDALSGGYVGVSSKAFFSFPFWSGLAGLLVSPGKGLLVYSPFLLVLLASVRRSFPEAPERRRLSAALWVAIAMQIGIYARTDYRAGFCYGPRFLLDLVPALVFVLAPALPSFSRPRRRLLAAGIAAGVFIQAVGAFCYPSGVSDYDLHVDGRAVWRPDRAPFLTEAAQGIQPFRLLGPRYPPNG